MRLYAYRTGQEAFSSALHEVQRDGTMLNSREGPCREVLGWGARIIGDTLVSSSSGRRMKASYLGAEVLWYLSATPYVDMIREYAPSYPQWCDKDANGKLYMAGAAGDRIGDQLDAAAELLRREPETRQCVIASWEERDLKAAARHQPGTPRPRNLPCYVAFEAWVRNNELVWHTHMRSQDAWLGLPCDLFAFSCMQQRLAEMVGVKVGIYLHSVGSLHLYAKHAGRAQVLNTTDGPLMMPRHRWHASTPSKNAVDQAITAETAIRQGARLVDVLDMTPALPGDSMLLDMVLCCGVAKFEVEAERREAAEHLSHPGLRMLALEEVVDAGR